MKLTYYTAIQVEETRTVDIHYLLIVTCIVEGETYHKGLDSIIGTLSLITRLIRNRLSLLYSITITILKAHHSKFKINIILFIILSLLLSTQSG